jgi:poly-beta-1,6-N-acetyl-D-glucosamine synthase
MHVTPADGARSMQLMHNDPRVDGALVCSVGIMAYNEAANIGGALASLLNQCPQLARIDELIVVASGCTDATVPIVAEFARKDSRVRLLEQARREGKASAINLFMRNARAPILMMVGADVLVKDGTVDALLRHFRDETVGMVGAHPVPVNDEGTFLGHAAHLVWRLHDRVAQERPKLGEAIAFRNVFPGIPIDTPVDEISIEALITQLKYRLVYEPAAIVYNRGPATIGDYLKQRRRIAAGHLQIRQQQGYSAATMSVWRVARALLQTTDAYATPRAACWTAGTVAMEAWARVLGAADYGRRRQHTTWQVVDSTKSAIGADAAGHRPQSVMVFRIIDFHQHELEHGAHRAQLLHRGVLQQVRRMLGSAGTVSTERSGTIVAVVAEDRSEAEARAERVIDAIEATPIPANGEQHGVRVKLTCGIIAFLQSGDATALTVPRRAEMVGSAQRA